MICEIYPYNNPAPPTGLQERIKKSSLEEGFFQKVLANSPRRVMELISEKTVKKNWCEVALFSPLRANIEMMKIGRNQPNLLAFVAELSNNMDREVHELALYMFSVIYRIFQKSYGKIKKVTAEEITECYEYNQNLLDRLKESHEQFLDGVTSIEISRQPHVLRYIVDALMNEEEGEDALVLSEEQKILLFLLLKTVLDVLDQKA